MTNASEPVRSVYFDQTEILAGIMRLHTDGKIDADLTYGNGKFWSNLPCPEYRFDIDPQCDGVVKACSTKLPLPGASLRSVIFDPPFLTYIRAARDGNGNMIMANRFAGYWTYSELEAHYIGTLREAARVLMRKGKFIIKCQDIIHNHRMHCTHANVIAWASALGFRIADLFVLPAKHRLPAPNRNGVQRHARSYHSYFLVFELV